MALTIKKQKKKALLTFDGAFTIYEVSDYREKLLNLFSEKNHFEMNLMNVDECDAAGIQFIISFLKQKDSGKEISVTGISDAVKDKANILGIRPEIILKEVEV